MGLELQRNDGMGMWNSVVSGEDDRWQMLVV
jgi:hypothetical protein